MKIAFLVHLLILNCIYQTGDTSLLYRDRNCREIEKYSGKKCTSYDDSEHFCDPFKREMSFRELKKYLSSRIWRIDSGYYYLKFNLDDSVDYLMLDQTKFSTSSEEDSEAKILKNSIVEKNLLNLKFAGKQLLFNGKFENPEGVSVKEIHCRVGSSKNGAQASIRFDFNPETVMLSTALNIYLLMDVFHEGMEKKIIIK